jgi:microcystin-dependent protein
LSTTGGGLPHNNLQPYLGMTFIIALQGIFPPRA